jgi:pyridoxine 5-phosphate synthase
VGKFRTCYRRPVPLPMQAATELPFIRDLTADISSTEMCSISRKCSASKFNLEGYPSPEFLDLVLEVRPTQCTLVPDPPDALTSNAGWDLASGGHNWLREILARLRDHGIRTSLFLEADITQVPRARALGAHRIELFTSPYAHAFGTAEGDRILQMHREAARAAREEGLAINAGHDLNLTNLPAYVATVDGLAEVSIGHALICDALYMGLRQAVTAYWTVLSTWRAKRSFGMHGFDADDDRRTRRLTIILNRSRSCQLADQSTSTG